MNSRATKKSIISEIVESKARKEKYRAEGKKNLKSTAVQ